MESDNKVITLISNIEAELLLKFQEYAETSCLSNLLYLGRKDINSLVAYVLTSLADGGMAIKPDTTAKIAIESGAKKALWVFNNFRGVYSLEKRLLVRLREDEVLHELLKILDLRKQIQDLK